MAIKLHGHSLWHTPRDQWHAYLGDPTIADAVLDRLVHNAYPITLKGPSRRKEKA